MFRSHGKNCQQDKTQRWILNITDILRIRLPIFNIFVIVNTSPEKPNQVRIRPLLNTDKNLLKWFTNISFHLSTDGCCSVQQALLEREWAVHLFGIYFQLQIPCASKYLQQQDGFCGVGTVTHNEVKYVTVSTMCLIDVFLRVFEDQWRRSEYGATLGHIGNIC